MKKRTEEKEELESAIQKLSKKINELANIQEDTEEEIQRLLKIKETMTKTYTKFMIAKSELAKYGIGMENIDQFVKCVVGIAKENYDPVPILAKIAGYENLKKDANYYKSEVNVKRNWLN